MRTPAFYLYYTENGNGHPHYDLFIPRSLFHLRVWDRSESGGMPTFSGGISEDPTEYGLLLEAIRGDGNPVALHDVPGLLEALRPLIDMPYISIWAQMLSEGIATDDTQAAPEEATAEPPIDYMSYLNED